MLRRLAGIAGLLLIAVASASAQFYAKRKLDIRAGIVVIDSAQTASTKEPINYTPHVWYNLDSDPSVKPAGWNIYNPRANTQVSPQILTRWANIGIDLGFAAPTLGASITKSSAAYWEFRLSQVSDQQLADYDILLLSAYGYTNLNTAERERLRKFVDQGGVLWVDLASTSNFANAQVNTFPVPFQNQTVLGAQPLTSADIFHPLMTTPYTLSLANLEQMRVDTSNFAAPIDLAALGMSSYLPIESWLASDYQRLMNVVASSAGRPAVMSAKLGDGFVVVTTSEVAMALNRVSNGVGYDVNNRFDGVAPRFDRSTQLAAKFVVNMLYLTSGYSHPGGGTRKPNANLVDLQPPLLMRFADESGTGALPARQQTPVLYKGLMVVSSNDRVYVYDATPKTDLDGDGNPDDGIQDYTTQGTSYDLLWVSQSLGGPISPPACAEIPSSNIKDQIFVQGSNGVLYSFDAFQVVNGSIQGYTAAPPLYAVNPPASVAFDTSEPDPGPYAPTVHDGVVYVTEVTNGTGQVWAADPIAQGPVTSSGTEPWRIGGDGLSTLPEPSNSATIAYIPIQDNSGGYDRVMYLPGRPKGVPGPTGNASLTSLWMGVRGESPPPDSLTFDPGELVVVTRAARQGLHIYTPGNTLALTSQSLGVKLTILYPNGDPFTVADMKQYFAGTVTGGDTGILRFALLQALPANVGVRLDYSIDWGTGVPQMTTQIIRGQVYFPDDPTIVTQSNKRRVIGNVAVSPRGTVYCVVSNQVDTDGTPGYKLDGGAYFALREDVGRGGFRLLTRYDLYPEHQVTLNQAQPQTYPETLTDSDPVTNFMPPFMQGRFTHFTFMGGPSVRNGTVYVTVSARKGNSGISQFVPYTILMAFKGEPDPPEIRVGDIGSGFSLRQPDFMRSPNKQTPTVFNEQGQGKFVYDRGEGVVRFDNLMPTNRGPITNAFSLSQPIIIRRTNQPDTLVEPDAAGSKWNPLLWYSVMHGVQATGGAMTTGDSVFVPGASVIPNLDKLISSGQIIVSGMINAWRGTMSPTDPFVFPDGTRPWLRQAYQLKFSGSGPVANPNYLWPQLQGLRNDVEDYIIRARQAKTGNSTSAYGVVAGEGVLASWGDKGVYSFSHADFLIADEGRLGRFDAAGNPLWISPTSASTGSADVGAVGDVKPLTRPVRAYPVGTNDILVADPGANRIVRLDLSGRETRSITSFKLDPNAIPDGYEANEALTLNQPRDVAMWSGYALNGAQYWTHYLIADTGNKRLIEVVDKFNVVNGQVTDVVLGANGERQLGVLYWHSPSNYSGKAFDYNSVSRVYDPSTNRFFYMAGIGSTLPTRVDAGLDSATGGTNSPREAANGNGGIVIFDPTTPANNVLVNKVWVPAIGANTYWDFATGTFNSPAAPAQYHAMANLTSVSARPISTPQGVRVSIMFTDASGVYEIYQPNPGGDWQVDWMLPNEAYRAMRRIGGGSPDGNSAAGLRATYARRLDSGDIVVVNGYVGRTLNGARFSGEVTQINGDFDPSGTGVGFDFGKANLGFDISMIVFQLPPISGTRGLVMPVFADRR